MINLLSSSIIICFFCCPSVTLKESQFGRDDDDGPRGNGTLAMAQQNPHIKWTTDEERAPNAALAADEMLQSTQLFRTANAKKFRNSVPSNEDRLTQDEAVRLRNVAKDVEEKLGLAPPWPNLKLPFGISSKRALSDVYPPAIDSPPLLRRFVGTAGESAAGGTLQRIRSQNALVASLLRQQRELAAQQQNVIRPIVGGNNLIGQQQQQFEREQQQQRLVQQQQQFQTLLQQQLAAIQQQRQLQQQQQQQQLLLNSKRQSSATVVGRNERLGASRPSSTSSRTNNFEKFAPPGFFGPANPLQPSPSTAVFPPKSVPTSALGVRLGGLPSATAPIFGGVQPESKFAVQPPPISPPFRPISSVDPSAASAADLSSLLQKLAWNNNPSTNQISSLATVGDAPPPIVTVLSNQNGRVAQVAPLAKPQQQERPLVVKLVTTAGNNEQQLQNNNNNNNNNVALQQIVLQEQQRIVELLEREQYREQLVQNSRRELQSVQEQQQRILELLDAAEREKQQQQQLALLSRGNRRTVPKATTATTTAQSSTTASLGMGQQQSLADANLLRGLLQAFSGLITPQQGTGSTAGSVLPTQSAATFVPVGQQQQQLQLPTIGGQFANMPQQQQQQFQPVQQLQQPNSAAVQYVAVYDPSRVAQQQQFNSAFGAADGTVSAAAIGAVQPQEIGAVQQVQQQQQIFGSLLPLPQPQQQIGAITQPQLQQPQQIGAVPLFGWLPTGDNTVSGGLLWQQLQQQQNTNTNDGNGPLQLQSLVNSQNIGQRPQPRRQDVQQAIGAVNGAKNEEEVEGKAEGEEEGEEAVEEDGRRGGEEEAEVEEEQ